MEQLKIDSPQKLKSWDYAITQASTKYEGMMVHNFNNIIYFTQIHNIK